MNSVMRRVLPPIIYIAAANKKEPGLFRVLFLFPIKGIHELFRYVFTKTWFVWFDDFFYHFANCSCHVVDFQILFCRALFHSRVFRAQIFPRIISFFFDGRFIVRDIIIDRVMRVSVVILEFDADGITVFIFYIDVFRDDFDFFCSSSMVPPFIFTKVLFFIS